MRNILAVAAAMAAMAAVGDPLTDFWRDNDGKSVRRLPVNVVPENVFWSFGNRDFPDGMKTFNRMTDEAFAKSTYNCVTLTLRCNPELGDAETIAAARDFIRKAHANGVKVYMDTDPRIARAEYFRSWPDEKQGFARVAAVTPTNGVASFAIVFSPVQDHMSWGSRSAYRPYSGKVLSALAVKGGIAALDFTSARRVEAAFEAPVRNWTTGERGSVVDYSEVTVKGTVSGLAADETLVVTALADYNSIDVFSPNLLPFTRSLMERYRAVGADGGMRDEWGLFPNYDPDGRSFAWSPHMAAAYRKQCGRDLAADYPLMAFGPKGDDARSAAAGAYMKTVLNRMVEIECDFYATDKRLFGEDVYVVKHCTWYDRICPQNFFHDGLDWWQAKRDWAQGDENAPLYALLGMSKKFGGPVWLNEGYTARSTANALRVWTYALSGGRQVYHGLYSGNPKEMEEYNAMPWQERRVRTALDLCRPANVAAQSRARLPSLITRAQVDCPIAFVFGHESLVDWTRPGWNDYGYRHIFALNSQGWWCDAYPGSEFALGTFKVDESGYLRVGQQRYLALALHGLRPGERAALDRVLAGRKLETKIFDAAETAAIAAYVEARGAVRQPPIRKQTPVCHDYPDPDGTLRLIDGTAIRVKADLGNLFGLPIAETIESNGVKAEVEAQGLCAVRAEKGEVVALAAGGLKRISAPGLAISLEKPEDVVLLKIDGTWHGVWQTEERTAPVPERLAALTSHWIRLLLPEEKHLK